MPTLVQGRLEDIFPGDWDSVRALAHIKHGGFDGQIPYLAEGYRASCQPIDGGKLRQRLTALGMTMAPNRPPAEATMWLHETARLLGDIPEDILCAALDEHQRQCKFLPTIAEIRERADGPMAKRRRDAARLDAMARLIASGQPIPQLAPPKPKPVMERRGEPMTAEETEELNAILARIGAATRYRADGSRYEVSTKETKVDRGPPRKPTRADYIALGVDPAILDSLDDAA